MNEKDKEIKKLKDELYAIKDFINKRVEHYVKIIETYDYKMNRSKNINYRILEELMKIKDKEKK